MNFAEHQKRIWDSTLRRKLIVADLSYRKPRTARWGRELGVFGEEKERKEASQMNNEIKKHCSFGSLLRRGTAFALSCAMGLSFLPGTAWAASSFAGAATVETDNTNKPKIEFQMNIVRTEYGTLTGTAELSLRVGPSNTDPTAGATSVSFHSLATALQFSTELLTPIDWEWTAADSTVGTTNPHEISLTTDVDGNSFNKYYQVAIPAKKNDTLPATGAIAKCGIVDNTTASTSGATTNVANGTQALLFFKAEAYNQPITLTEMTTLAVIRFKVNSALMDTLTLKPDTAGVYSTGYTLYSDLSKETDSSGDPAKTVTKVVTLNDIATNTTSTITLSGFDTIVGFASDADIAASDPDSGMALFYSSGSNKYYFVPRDQLGDAAAPTVTVTHPADPSVSLDAPQTDNDRILAQGATTSDDSYTSNLLPAENVSFTVVSELSFADSGDGRENMATILFYDWDDTLIGTLIVPRSDDARALVNEYVRDNLIHPDLRVTSTTSATDKTTLVTSLARENTYRGKYPNTPAAEGATSTTPEGEGELYPLTNKLDYVFLKRPLEQQTDATTGKPISEWKQTDDGTGNAAWDEDYPYIYGWAFVGKTTTKADGTKTSGAAHQHPENVWTTIGVGELSDYTDLVDGAYVSTPTTAPVTLTSEDENFTFANFNFSEIGNSLEKGSVFAVKAVYEPGESLQNSAVDYRMSSEPYYNKLNYNSSDVGGAYSVDFTLERNNVKSDGTVCGVARIREPAVRQDTTADILWESQYLENATVTEADAKTKTTYTYVSADNGEAIEIQLVLSARQNKVDWYLVNVYNTNFVGGGRRTTGNASFTGTAHVIDNYNYKTATSDVSIDGVSADYYDASYEEREGSYGFVLFGTLNNLAQKLTEYDNGTLSSSDFDSYISESNLIDANIRSNTGEKPEFLTLSDFQDALKAAYAAAKADYTAHPTSPIAWDTDHDCAQFTYHQLQLYVSDYMATGSATLDDAAHADLTSITWCHLHDSCAAAASGKPRDWAGLIALAGGSDADKKDKICLLTLSELETMTHLRKDANGTAFASNSDLADAVISAVSALGASATWDTIQDYIIRGSQSDAATYSQENYWWYDGSTSISFSDLSDTVAAVQDAITAPQMPDGSTPVVRTAKINQLRSAFEENKTSTTTANAWNNATKNLSLADGAKFSTWEAFRDALINAETARINAGEAQLTYADGDDVAEKRRTYWNKLQNHILTGSYSTTDPDPDRTTYWWYDGAVQVKDLATLIKAAQDMNSGKPASWAGFTADKLYDPAYPDFYFARDFAGNRYDTTNSDPDPDNNFDHLKDLILQYVKDDKTHLKDNAPDWNRFQYYLIHGEAPATNSILKNECGYYWWGVGDHTAQPVSFDLSGYTTAEEKANALATALMDAAFRATYNGNENAWKALNETVLKEGRLVASISGTESAYPGDFTLFGVGDLSSFKDKIVALMQVYDGGTLSLPASTATWHQIQHYLLTGKTPAATWIENNTNYWWKTEDSAATEDPRVTLLAEMQDLIKAVAQAVKDGTDTTAPVAALQAFITVDNLKELEFKYSKTAALNSTQVKRVISKVTWITDYDALGCWSGTDFTITWEQIEYILYRAAKNNKEAYLGHADAVTYLNGQNIPIPEWLPTTSSLMATSLAMPVYEFTLNDMVELFNSDIADMKKMMEEHPEDRELYEAEIYKLIAALTELLNGSSSDSNLGNTNNSSYTNTPDTTVTVKPVENGTTETPQETVTPSDGEQSEENGGAANSNEVGEAVEVGTYRVDNDTVYTTTNDTQTTNVTRNATNVAKVSAYQVQWDFVPANRSAEPAKETGTSSDDVKSEEEGEAIKNSEAVIVSENQLPILSKPPATGTAPRSRTPAAKFKKRMSKISNTKGGNTMTLNTLQTIGGNRSLLGSPYAKAQALSLRTKGSPCATSGAVINRAPAKAERFCGKRRNSEMSELSPLGGSEGYVACDDVSEGIEPISSHSPLKIPHFPTNSNERSVTAV